MDSMGLSQQEFAQKLGMSPASLSNIFNGRSNPTNNHVQAIHRAFPNINTNWLMFGEGTMLNDDAKKKFRFRYARLRFRKSEFKFKFAGGQ